MTHPVAETDHYNNAIAKLRIAHAEEWKLARSMPFASLGHFSLGPVDVDALYAESTALARATAALGENIYIPLDQPERLGKKYPHLVDAFAKIGEVETASRDESGYRLIAGVRGAYKYTLEPVVDGTVPLAIRPHVDMVPITDEKGAVVPLYTAFVVCDVEPTLTYPQVHRTGIDMGYIEEPEGVLLCHLSYPYVETIDKLAEVSEVSNPVPITAGELTGVMGLHSGPMADESIERTFLNFEVRHCSTRLYNQVLSTSQQISNL